MEEIVWERFRNTLEVLESSIFNEDKESGMQNLEDEIINLRSWVIGFVQGVEANNVRR